MEQRIERYIRSGHPGICIVSLEETRVEAVLKRLAEKLDYGLHVWNLTVLGTGAAIGKRLAINCLSLF